MCDLIILAMRALRRRLLQRRRPSRPQSAWGDDVNPAPDAIRSGPGQVVDLRSEAVAPLHPAVRLALSQAPEGSDSYDEDPSVHELEQRLADMFGMDCALLVPTGRLANTLAVGALSTPGSEVLADADSHIVRSEYGLVARLWGLLTRTFTSDHGRASPEHLSPLLGRLENVTVPTSLVCVEDTHSLHGGTVQNLAAMRGIADVLAKRGVKLYCDGARLWYANVVQEVPWVAYGGLYDGLSVSLVKGIGAPVGAAVLLREGQRSRLRDLRRMLGGAWVRPGPLAHAALRALEVNLPDVHHDCVNAARLAATLRREFPGLVIQQETNVVMFDVPDAAAFFEKCRAAGVLVFRYTPTRIRLVLHRGIAPESADRAAAVLCDVLGSMRKEAAGEERSGIKR
jgi:threonine aldolase